MNEKETIIGLIDTHPKHYSKMIRTRDVLWEWVKTHSKIVSDNTTAMIYSAIHQVDDQCKYGNTKKFSGRSVGFTSCGPTGKCQCAKEAVSASVSANKAARTQEQILAENTKREQTSLKKYGVTNNAQTEQAKNAHREFYADPINVVAATNKNKLAKIKNHGQATYNNRAKAKETTLIKYGVENPYNIESVREKNKLSIIKKTDNKTYLTNGYKRFRDYINTRHNFTLLTPCEEYNGIRQKDAHVYMFKCNSCDHVVSKKFYHGKGLSCEKCFPVSPAFVSGEEQEVFNFIRNELGVTDGIQGDRSFINPFEIDMLFHSYKIAIEYNGLFWHSELGGNKHKNYHRDKLKLINARGYRLISIFSDEWNNKKNIVKSRLRHVFGKNNGVYYARKLALKEISHHECSEFMNKYHLQGTTVSRYRYGLYKDDELIAAMTFSKERKIMNGGDGYELVRFATNGTSVIGGASRLLKHFIRIHSPNKIVSYADLRWSEGNVYETMGFVKAGDSTIGYWYMDNYSIRYHRYAFSKHKLVTAGEDSTKTEWEIMQLKGYDRIWDCGQQKFEYKVITA